MKKEQKYNSILMKRLMYSLLALITFSFGLYAYNSLYNDPSIMGHSLGEIEGDIWNKSGNNVFYTEGNVGIGTNNPQVSLEVNGTIRLRNLANCGSLKTNQNGDLVC